MPKKRLKQELITDYLQSLKELETILSEKDYPMFLNGGTLLGAAQQKTFLLHDDDIDISTICKATNQSEANREITNIIIPYLISKGYKCSTINWSEWRNGVYVPKKMFGQYHIQKGKIELDLWLGFFEQNKFYQSICFYGEFDKSDILPLKTLTLANKTFNVPNNYDKYLTFLYHDWKSPNPNGQKPQSIPQYLQSNVLRMIDAYGWAYHFTTKEQQKYTWHDVHYCRIHDYLTYLDSNPNIDVVYYPSPGMSKDWVRMSINKLRKRDPRTKVIGAFSGFIFNKYEVNPDLLVSISWKDTEQIRRMYDIPTIFLPEAVDTEFFIPKQGYTNFQVGWVGRECVEKRTRLLDLLCFPVLKKQDHEQNFLIKERTTDDVRDFYNKIDCLVLTSEHECMPRVVLEAMAMGLPVVATNCDSMEILLDKEWIVPVYDETNCINEINKKLKLLSENPKLREQVGKRNREWVERFFSWKNNQVLWDKVYSYLYLNDIDNVKKVSEDYCNKLQTAIKQNNSLKILKIIDEYGWAYHFLGMEQQRYSKYDIDVIKIEDITTHLNDYDFNKYDVVYLHSPNMWGDIEKNLIKHIRKSTCKIIGGYGGEVPHMYELENIDLVTSISLKYVPTLNKMYPTKPVVFLPEAVDTKYFTPNDFNKDRFNVGYVGRPCEVKRTHLLDKLNYPVMKQMDWSKKVFVKERTLDTVREFYKGIDVLVLTSASECMPRVVLEAMAMGLPVVATDVGSLRMVLDQMWLIPPDDETMVVNSMNKCLDLLKNNPQLRKQVGERNRQWIEKYLSWHSVTPLWDNVFNAIYRGDSESCKQLTNDYIQKFSHVMNINSYLSQPSKQVLLTTSVLPPKKTEVIPVKCDNKVSNIDILILLKSQKIDFWLLGESCLQCINKKELNTTLHIGVKDSQSRDKVSSLSQQYKVSIKVDIEPERKTKEYNVGNIVIQVPCPVVVYLEVTFKKPFDKLVGNK